MKTKARTTKTQETRAAMSDDPPDKPVASGVGDPEDFDDNNLSPLHHAIAGIPR